MNATAPAPTQLFNRDDRHVADLPYNVALTAQRVHDLIEVLVQMMHDQARERIASVVPLPQPLAHPAGYLIAWAYSTHGGTYPVLVTDDDPMPRIRREADL